MTRSIIGFFVALQACSSAATPTRSAVFRALVEQVVVPEAHALSGAQRALTSELAELDRAPSEAALTTARTTWRAAALAWARMEALRLPVNDDGRCVLRATFWPTRSAQLEELLRDGSSLDADQIDALGIDVRGMYALEWLLFANEGPALLRADAEGRRARQLTARAGAERRAVCAHPRTTHRRRRALVRSTDAGRGRESQPAGEHHDRSARAARERTAWTCCRA